MFKKSFKEIEPENLKKKSSFDQKAEFESFRNASPFRLQLLKWIGSKQRYAQKIIEHFPSKYGRYIEPFLGSAGILAALHPEKAFASDVFPPLMEIWTCLKKHPETLIKWYEDRLRYYQVNPQAYFCIRDRYNESPNGADLLFLSRCCYGGILRFRKSDGYMSTPIGSHLPIGVDEFRKRVYLWHDRVKGTTFDTCDYREAFARARSGDLVYCDPPYNLSQNIIYGSHNFSFADLIGEVEILRARNVKVFMSIDSIDLFPLAKEVFHQSHVISAGKSKLNNFYGERRRNYEKKEYLLSTESKR